MAIPRLPARPQPFRHRVQMTLRRPLSLALLLIASSFVVLVTAPPASALALDVRVTIKQVDALDSFEEPGDADFYGVTTIDGTERTSDQCQFEDDDHITPDWEFKKEGIDLSEGCGHGVSIEIWDDDDPCDELFSFRGDDDQGDITPTAGRTLTFEVDLAPCALTGGVTASCMINIQSAGTADDDIASIVFQVAIGEPPSAPGHEHPVPPLAVVAAARRHGDGPGGVPRRQPPARHQDGRQDPGLHREQPWPRPPVRCPGSRGVHVHHTSGRAGPNLHATPVGSWTTAVPIWTGWRIGARSGHRRRRRAAPYP